MAAARVLESAVGLARAETRLMLAHARTELVRIVGALLAGMLATSAAQVALLLCALSPVLLASWSRSALVLALVPSLCVSAIGATLALLALRSLRGSPAAPAVRK